MIGRTALANGPLDRGKLVGRPALLGRLGKHPPVASSKPLRGAQGPGILGTGARWPRSTGCRANLSALQHLAVAQSLAHPSALLLPNIRFSSPLHTTQLSTSPCFGQHSRSLVCSRHFVCPPCIFLRSPSGQCTLLAVAQPLTRLSHWPSFAPATCLLLSAPCCTCCTCRELQAGLMWLLVT